MTAFVAFALQAKNWGKIQPIEYKNIYKSLTSKFRQDRFSAREAQLRKLMSDSSGMMSLIGIVKVIERAIRMSLINDSKDVNTEVERFLSGVFKTVSELARSALIDAEL